jgi:hypothetical protein
MYFFSTDQSKIESGIDLIFHNIAQEYHGTVFHEFQEVIDFIDFIINRLTLFSNDAYSGKGPRIYFAPSHPKREEWIDITIYVEGILTCRIIKAKQHSKF